MKRIPIDPEATAVIDTLNPSMVDYLDEAWWDMVVRDLGCFIEVIFTGPIYFFNKPTGRLDGTGRPIWAKYRGRKRVSVNVRPEKKKELGLQRAALCCVLAGVGYRNIIEQELVEEYGLWPYTEYECALHQSLLKHAD